MNFSSWLKSLFTKTPEVKIVNQLVLNILNEPQPADGVSASVVQALVTDTNGAPVPGALVNFSSPSGGVNPVQGSTDKNGLVSVSLVSSTVGPATLAAVLADGTTASINSLYFVAVPAPVAPAAETDLDAFAAKLKSVLLLAGHDVESVFAEAVALAKKL